MFSTDNPFEISVSISPLLQNLPLFVSTLSPFLKTFFSFFQALNGRWFGGKKLTAESYDGTTNYQVTETEEELKRRLGEWEEFLAQGEELEEKTEPVNQEVIYIHNFIFYILLPLR